MIKVASVLFYAFYLTDRFGRRPLLIIGSSMKTGCLLYLAVYLGVRRYFWIHQLVTCSMDRDRRHLYLCHWLWIRLGTRLFIDSF